MSANSRRRLLARAARQFGDPADSSGKIERRVPPQARVSNGWKNLAAGLFPRS